MSKNEIKSLKSLPLKDLTLDKNVFSLEVKNDILHSYVRWYLANKRQGTHMTKTKGLVSGGGKKPFKQKGTGNARQGSTRSPLMPGGGTMFGPVPRDYSFKLSKNFKKLALKMALSYLYANKKISVVDSIEASGKTKDLAINLKDLSLNKALIVGSKADSKLERASSNLEKFKFSTIENVNVYDLLKFDHLLISKNHLELLSKRAMEGV